MTEIELLVEGTNIVVPDYTNRHFTQDQVERETYRNFVSGGPGIWDRGGEIQLELLTKHGLRPEHRLIDVGCGALRAGRHFIDYLEPAHYYGVDANRELITIGYDRELTDEQRARLPVENLRANDRFNTDFGVTFDMAIAQSVFTHVSLNHMKVCLYRLAKVMRPGGVFFASFIEQPETRPVDAIFERVEGGRTHLYEKNVFWYRRSDMKWASEGSPWKFAFVGRYGSPQGQMMVSYTRLPDDEVARQAAAAHAAVNRKIKDGGAAAYVLRARRRAARIISPYPNQ